jgi:hypothetical protein
MVGRAVMTSEVTGASHGNDDVIALIESNQLGRIADYAARGRPYREVPHEILIEIWTTTLMAMAADSINLATIGFEQDLACEFRLRQKEPPFDLVKQYLERYFAAMAARFDEDPEGYADVNRRLERDIEDFKNHLAGSKN